MGGVWLRMPFGYGGRLLAEAGWLRRPSGYGRRLVTEAVWLRKPCVWLRKQASNACWAMKHVGVRWYMSMYDGVWICMKVCDRKKMMWG